MRSYTKQFYKVASNNDIGELIKLLQTSKDKIQSSAISDIFKNAAKEGHAKVISTILELAKDKLLSGYISDSFEVASRNGHTKVVSTILKFAKNELSIDAILSGFDYTVKFNHMETTSQIWKYKKDLIEKYLEKIDPKKVNKIITGGAREGKVNMLHSLYDNLNINETIIDPKKNFFHSTFYECFGKRESLQNIDFPGDKKIMTIAQNFCSTILLLEDGNIFKIKGYEAVDVIDYLVDNSFISDEYQEQNILTIYLNPNHAYVAINSESEDFVRGFYPAINKKTPATRLPDDYPVELTVYTITSGTIFAASYAILSTICCLPMRIVNSNMKDSIPFYGSLVITSLIETLIYFLSDLIMPHLGNQPGMIIDDSKTVTVSNYNNHLKFKLFLKKEEITEAIKYVHLVAKNCDSITFEHCTYNPLTNNCIDFIQDVYTAATGHDINILKLFSYEQVWGHNTYNDVALFGVCLKNSFNDAKDILNGEIDSWDYMPFAF